MVRADYKTGFNMFKDGCALFVNVDTVASDMDLSSFPEEKSVWSRGFPGWLHGGGSFFDDPVDIGPVEFYEIEGATKGAKPRRGLKKPDGTIVVEVKGTQRSAHQTAGEYMGRSFQHCLVSSSETKAADGSTSYYATIEPSDNAVRRDRIYILDTETTGLDPQVDELLQVSITDMDGNTVFNRFYRPERTESWPEAQRINGISPEDVADCPHLSEDLASIQAVLDGCRELVIFNAEFDGAFLGRAGLRLSPNVSVRDAMVEYAQRKGYGNYCKLTKAADEIGFKYKAHDALEDCRATAAVWTALVKEFEYWSLGREEYGENLIDISGYMESAPAASYEKPSASEAYRPAPVQTPQSVETATQAEPKKKASGSKIVSTVAAVILYLIAAFIILIGLTGLGDEPAIAVPMIIIGALVAWFGVKVMKKGKK